jgi:membrane-bound ClpP family serine protease
LADLYVSLDPSTNRIDSSLKSVPGNSLHDQPKLKLRAVVGVLLVILGFWAGVWEWIVGGLVGGFPLVGVMSCVLGLYLVLSGILHKGKDQPLGLVGSIGILVTSYLLGKATYDKLSEYLRSRAEKDALSNEELIKLEKQLDDMNGSGQLDSEKYVKVKELIAELKKKTGS